MLDLIDNTKTAEITAEQMGAGGGQGGAAPPQGGAPAPDPAVMQAAAGGDPLAGMQQQPMTLEDAAKQGDPLAAAILEIKEVQKLILEQIATLLDNTGAQVPASMAVQSQLKQIEQSSKAAAAPIAESMGVAANPGDNGGLVLTTGLASSPAAGRGSQLASHWRKRT